MEMAPPGGMEGRGLRGKVLRTLKGDSGGAEKVAVGGKCHWSLRLRLRCVCPLRR